MCSQFGWDTASGISREQFEDLVGDEEETTDEELREILVNHSRHARGRSSQRKDSRRSSRSSKRWSRQSSVVQLQDETSGFNRPELIDAVFRLLDVKKENILRSTELQDFAMFTGFDGSNEEWQEQYQEMCSQFGWDTASGISREQFEDLVGDEKETSDEELRQILVNHSRHAQSEPEEEEVID
eukprot:symbB.v1.2.020151.t1/scaffold1642.1/size107908/10